MMNSVNLKVLAFAAMGISFAWLAFGLNSKGNLLDKALAQLDSARTEIHSAQKDMGNAKILMDSAQKVMSTLRLAAQYAEKDLKKLNGERDKIHSDITKTIASSRQDLKKYGNSIQDILNEQQQMMRTLDSINIKTLIVVSAKK